MKYDIDYPPEPDGPLWDSKGTKWEKTAKGRWEPILLRDTIYRMSHTWTELLEACRPLYDTPQGDAAWEEVQADHAYYAEIYGPDPDYCPRSTGLFISADGNSLTSAYGHIYRRGEATIRRLREYEPLKKESNQ